MYILNKIFLLNILIFSFLYLNVQAQKLDSLPKKKEKDTIQKGFSKPTGIRIGIDLIGLGQFAFADKNAVHITSDISFNNKHLWALEYTLASNQTSQKAIYKSQASIIRFGWMYNFLGKQSQEDVFALGLRLGNAWYNESIKAEVQSATFGTLPVDLSNRLGATWIELNMELKARIWKRWLTGYTARYQFKSQVRGDQAFSSYSIPSVGRLGRNNWGFQYCVWYLIDFKKK
ncbi:hypothetical protein AD998_12595 [bacterium 336/3]|nr:hypothetical protein AD998_12595 [bacterium 336/3]